ncbi:hypothetical protein U3516DRAFT_736882 [Neocallimastix sp. 'constans']
MELLINNENKKDKFSILILTAFIINLLVITVFFDDDPSVTHCDYVHKGFAMFQNEEIRCGKAYHDVCKHNYECSSYNYYVPLESTTINNEQHKKELSVKILGRDE